MIEVRWHGRGGQGSFTVARLLGLAASVYDGKYAQAFPSFGPERRGAPVLGFTRIDTEKITDRSELDVCDYVVILDETLWGNDVLVGLKENSLVIINTKDVTLYEKACPCPVIAIDATQMAIDYLGIPITNTAMLGALVGTSGIVNSDSCKAAICASMNPKMAAKNVALFEHVMEQMKNKLSAENLCTGGNTHE